MSTHSYRSPALADPILSLHVRPPVLIRAPSSFTIRHQMALTYDSPPIDANNEVKPRF